MKIPYNSDILTGKEIFKILNEVRKFTQRAKYINTSKGCISMNKLDKDSVIVTMSFIIEKEKPVCAKKKRKSK